MHCISVMCAEWWVITGMPRRSWQRRLVWDRARIPRSKVVTARTPSAACTWKLVYLLSWVP